MSITQNSERMRRGRRVREGGKEERKKKGETQMQGFK